MTNEEYARRLGELYGEVMSLRKDEDYTINQPQMDKLCKVLELCIDSTIFHDSEVESVNLIPREEHGGVTVTFVLMSLNGEEEVARFCDVMRGCSAISIDATVDAKACISCTIPDVFIRNK